MDMRYLKQFEKKSRENRERETFLVIHQISSIFEIRILKNPDSILQGWSTMLRTLPEPKIRQAKTLSRLHLLISRTLQIPTLKTASIDWNRKRRKRTNASQDHLSSAHRILLFFSFQFNIIFVHTWSWRIRRAFPWERRQWARPRHRRERRARTPSSADRSSSSRTSLACWWRSLSSSSAFSLSPSPFLFSTAAPETRKEIGKKKKKKRKK